MISKDFNTGLIKAKKGASILAYGHEIEISTKMVGTQKTEVCVTSKLIGIQIIDWGANSKNEKEIIKLIANITK